MSTSFAPEEAAVLLRAAGAAPSLYNSQPWRFVVRNAEIRVYADPQLRMPCADPDARQQTIACGAALLNLRLAIEHLGHRPEVTLLPDPNDPLHLATVRRGRAGGMVLDRQLYRQIHLRRTNREPFANRGIHPVARQAMRFAAGQEGGSLRPIDALEERSAVAALMVRAIRGQRQNPELGNEMARWLRARAGTDGMPASSWSSVPFPVPGLDDYVREGDWELAVARLARTAPLFLLTTDGDARADWLAAGQTLQHVLLTASRLELGASFLNQVIESEPLRRELADVLGVKAYPQLILRIGYPATWPRPTLRRPLQMTDSA